eukprot:1936111-Heterocapsa_arctica.AAC.1
MPIATTFQEWRRALQAQVCAASGRGDECLEWLAECQVPGCSPDDFETISPKWCSLDAKLLA